MPIANPTAAEKRILDLFKTVNEFGPLHIVVADGNVDDGNLSYCAGQPDLNPDENELLTMLAEIPEERRFQLWENDDNAEDD